MSTATVTQDTTSNDIAIKPENTTYKRFVETDAEGKVTSVKYASGGKKLEALEKNTALSLAGEFTVRTYEVGTLDGLRELIGDEEEMINIVNRGLNQKASQKITEYLTAFDDKEQVFVNNPGGDVIDTREMLQEATQRRNLSPTDKAAKALTAAGFDRDKVMEILAQLQAAQANS